MSIDERDPGTVDGLAQSHSESGAATDRAADSTTISRRSLLTGSAGLTLGSLALIGGAAAEGPPKAGAGHGAAPGLGQRVYPVPSATAADVGRDPADLPPPITRREPQTVRVELETVELEGVLDQQTTYRYWTFNAKVPGPFVRVRLGDTVEVTLRNPEDSWMTHNVDFHAATGPGGGAALSTAAPGEQKSFRFKALNSGLYVYHCAVPPVASHISNGMYGMILVEPEEGLAPVDREFYVMQGEIYTEQPFGTAGLLTESYEKLINERPEYFVFNGHVGALTDHYPLKAKVGETVRIFFGVGGPNFTSSFHVIGEIFDRYYPWGTVTGVPVENPHVVTVPAGGTAITEMKLDVPGRYVLVDHALSRVERGLAGYLDIEGEENPEIFGPIS